VVSRKGGREHPTVAVGLHGAAGLGADHHDGAVQVVHRGRDLTGVGGVEDDQRHPGGPADDLRGQRGAAHAAQHDAVEALGLQLLAQLGELLDQRAGGRRQVQPAQPDRRLALRVRSPERGVLAGEPCGDVVVGQ